MAEHRMSMARVSPKYARQHGLNPNHHARVWCSCMDRPSRPPGYYSSRSRAEVVADPRRLGAFDHLGVIDLREAGSALALFRKHVEESAA